MRSVRFWDVLLFGFVSLYLMHFGILQRLRLIVLLEQLPRGLLPSIRRHFLLDMRCGHFLGRGGRICMLRLRLGQILDDMLSEL